MGRRVRAELNWSPLLGAHRIFTEVWCTTVRVVPSGWWHEIEDHRMFCVEHRDPRVFDDPEGGRPRDARHRRFYAA